MLENDFNILAAKVLANEATPEETARLRAVLAANATLRAEFTALQTTWAALEEGARLANAMDAPPSAPPLKRKEQWQATLARQFETRSHSATQPMGETGKWAAQDKKRAGKIIRISLVHLALAALFIAAAVVAT